MYQSIIGGTPCIVDRVKISSFLFVVFSAVFGFVLLAMLIPLDMNPGYTKQRTDVTSKGLHMLPNLLPLDGVWQRVGGTKFRFFVYAAYIESRMLSGIRVIAATTTRGTDKVFCRLWIDNRTLTLYARIRIIRENMHLKYSAAYVMCLLQETDLTPKDTVGAYLSVISVDSIETSATNLLTVKGTVPNVDFAIGTDINPLHVCVRPFVLSSNETKWMVEWLELNRLLGITHFYIYDQNMSDLMKCALNYYKVRGLVTLMPWNLPIPSSKITLGGQLAAINDCLHRSMASASWLLLIDFDEVVVPQNKMKISELLIMLAYTYSVNKIPGSYLFRNANFYKTWEDDPESPVQLVTSRKTRRLMEPFSYFNHSKYAVRPQDIIELGRYFVWEHIPGIVSESHYIPENMALLHHYQERCEDKTNNCLELPSTVDRSAHRWVKELDDIVQYEHKQISNTCSQKTQRPVTDSPLDI